MKRSICRFCLISISLALLLSCLILLPACGGGGGGGGGSENATITGTVSGTLVAVFDQNNSQVASTVASGTPKTFRLSLPAGTYRIYLIENEGTNNQRVFPLYAADDLTTNKFQIPSGANIDLGFVSNFSGNAIPANNPLSSGATSAGKDTSIPSSLSASVSSTSDMEGTWFVFGLTTQSGNPGWFYGTQTFGSDGVLTAGSTTDSTTATRTNSLKDTAFAVDPSGVVFSTDSGIFQQNRFNGILDRAKEIIPGTTTFATAESNTPGAIVGPALLTFVKQSTFAVSDLSGYWTAFALVLGSDATSSGWIWGDLEIGTSGLATFSSTVSNKGATSDGLANFSVSTGWLTASPDQWDPSLKFHGAVNSNQNIMFGVSGFSGAGLTGHALRISVRKATNCSLADLSGTWRTYTLGLGFGGGPTSKYGWNRSIVTIDSSGNVTAGPGTLSDGTAPPDAPGTTLGLVYLNNVTGTVTSSTNTTFHAALSSDKAIVVGTMTDQNGGYSLTIWVK